MCASNSFTWNEMKLFTKAIFWSSLWSLSFSPLCINIDHVNVHLGILNLSSIQNGESVPIMYHTRGRDPLSELDHQIISNRRGLKLNITKKWNVIQFPYLRFHMQKSNIDVLRLLSNIIKIIKRTHDCFTCWHPNRLHLLLANSKAVSPCRET